MGLYTISGVGGLGCGPKINIKNPRESYPARVKLNKTAKGLSMLFGVKIEIK